MHSSPALSVLQRSVLARITSQQVLNSLESALQMARHPRPTYPIPIYHARNPNGPRRPRALQPLNHAGLKMPHIERTTSVGISVPLRPCHRSFFAPQLEFAFEIGSGLLTEVRRLQSLLGERDKAIQDMKEEKDDLEKSVEALRTALRQQEQSAGRNDSALSIPTKLTSALQTNSKKRTGTLKSPSKSFVLSSATPNPLPSASSPTTSVSPKPSPLPAMPVTSTRTSQTASKTLLRTSRPNTRPTSPRPASTLLASRATSRTSKKPSTPSSPRLLAPGAVSPASGLRSPPMALGERAIS